MITVALFFYYFMKQEVTERVSQSNQQLLQVIEQDLTKTQDNILYAVNYYVNDPRFQSLLSNLKDLEGLNSYESLRNYNELKNIIELVEVSNLPQNTHVYIMNPLQFVAYSSPSVNPETVQEEWNSLRSRIDFDNTTTVQKLGGLDLQGISLDRGKYFEARVFRDRKGELLGTLLYAIPNNYFKGLFQVSNFGRVKLMESDGRLIYMSSPQNTQAESYPIINQMKMQRTGWMIQHETSQSEVTGKLTKVFLLFCVTLLICMGIFMLISIFLARQLYKPLNKIKITAEKFGQGNFSLRFAAKGEDEISVLGAAFNRMLDEIEKLISDIHQEQEEKRVVELQALFAQIRPHFLINTLNSMKCNLSLTGNKLQSKQMDSLISLLRAYMKVHVPGTLQTEIRLIQDYLAIMMMRNEMKIRFEHEIPEEFLNVTVPLLLLQPIVENAIVHGFVRYPKDACVSIKVTKESEWLVIVISDNGIGISEEKCSRLNYLLEQKDVDKVAANERVGLINVAQRLQLTYGSKAEMYCEGNELGGTSFYLKVPLSILL